MLAKSTALSSFPSMDAIRRGAKAPEKLRHAAIVVQAFARMIICRRIYFDKFVSAVLIQSTFRKKAAMNYRIKYLKSLFMIQMCIIRWKRRGGRRLQALHRIKRAIRRYMLNRILTRNCMSIYNTLVFGTEKDVLTLLGREPSALVYGGSHKYMAAIDDSVYDMLCDTIQQFRFRNDNYCCYLHCLAKNTNFKFSVIYRNLQDKGFGIRIHEFFKVDIIGHGITHHATQVDMYALGPQQVQGQEGGAGEDTGSNIFDSVWDKLHRPLLTYGAGFKLVYGLPWRCKSSAVTLRLLPDDPFTLIFEDTSMFQHTTRISLFQVRKLYAPDGTNMIGLQMDGGLSTGGGDKPKRDRDKTRKGGVTYEFLADTATMQSQWAAAIKAGIEKANEYTLQSVRNKPMGGDAAADAGGGGGGTVRSSITEAAEAFGAGGAGEYLTTHCYNSKIDCSFERNAAKMISSRLMDVLGIWIELWLNCNTANHALSSLPPSLILLSNSFSATRAYAQQSMITNPILLLGAMGCLLDVQNRNFFISTPHTPIFTGSKLAVQSKPKFVMPPTDVVAIEEAWESTHKPLLLKPVTLQAISNGCFGISTKFTVTFKLAPNGRKFIYQGTRGSSKPGYEGQSIVIKDIVKVSVYSPRHFAICMKGHVGVEVTGKNKGKSTAAACGRELHFHCPHVVTHSDWAVHKMWLESVKIAVQRETDPAFKHQQAEAATGSGTNKGKKNNQTAATAAASVASNVAITDAVSPVAPPKRKIVRRASVSNTEQNLSTMELEWRNEHKPLLLRGEVFTRPLALGNKKVELKLLPDLTTFVYSNVERHTQAPPTVIPLSLLRQLASKRNSSVFTLNTQHKQYEFSSDSPEVLNKWRNAIRVAIERHENPAYLSYLQKQRAATTTESESEAKLN